MFELLSDIEKYIQENLIDEPAAKEFTMPNPTVSEKPTILGVFSNRASKNANFQRSFEYIDEIIDNKEIVCQDVALSSEKEIRSRIEDIDEGFVDTLLKMIDASNMTDAECYTKAQLNRSHFWKIKNDPEYNIQKKTVFALILALELNYEDAEFLLMKAGYAFSNAFKMDLIIKYCIEHKIYDVIKVNDILYSFDQELLGAGYR